ncbi:sterol desaturase family protein [Bosea sp. AAP35]|uniref:sterol desaturase family protein n=1 Tax=Bosea sp. AAP35 TaxID=1523417 RepID=UPI0006B96317|nr:sterol desaturase family protein [Bosea sp. AAP35]
MTLLTEFSTLLGLVVAGVVVVMLVVGGFLEILNARHPERRIQKDRINRRKWKELRQAPVSIVTLSACFAFGLFAQQQGWALVPLELSWWSGPLMLLVSVVLYDAWFYWVHRLLHSRPFYRFHALHHKSVAPTVWSNHHESFMEALLNQAYYALIVFILPIPWQVLILQKLYDQVSGMLGHAGFEHFASPAGRAPWPLASTVFHDQHHGAFRFNYGHTFSLWDRWMGTLHPRYDVILKSFEPGGEGADRPTKASEGR